MIQMNNASLISLCTEFIVYLQSGDEINQFHQQGIMVLVIATFNGFM